MKVHAGCAAVAAVLSLFPSQAVGQASSAKTGAHLWKQCKEDVLFIDVDPQRLDGLVAPQFELQLEQGKARILIAAQDCPTYWFEGEEIGPTLEVHEWVAVQGAEDVRPVPGAETTLPTMHWYAVYTGSNNERSRDEWDRSGTLIQPLRTVTVRSSTSAVEGTVVIDGDRSYEWTAGPGSPFARLVAVNHDVYTSNTAGQIIVNRIQCLANVAAWGSQGELKVNGGTDPADVVSEGTHALTAHAFLPIWCRATLADGGLDVVPGR